MPKNKTTQIRIKALCEMKRHIILFFFFWFNPLFLMLHLPHNIHRQYKVRILPKINIPFNINAVIILSNIFEYTHFIPLN